MLISCLPKRNQHHWTEWRELNTYQSANSTHSSDAGQNSEILFSICIPQTDMAIPSRILERLASDEEILYKFEKPFTLKAPGLVFTNRRLIYYKPKSSGVELEEYSWRDVDKVSIEEGLIYGEIEFEMIGDHEIEFEDIPKRDVREMYAIATGLKENAYADKGKAKFLAGTSSPVPFQSASNQIGQRRTDIFLLDRIWTAIQAKINRILGIEDPRETLDVSYETQLNLLQNVKLSVAEFAISLERIELQKAKLQLSIDKLENQAKEALLANREDLARKALENRAILQARSAAIDLQITDLEDQQQKLMASESRLAIKVEAFHTKKETIKAEYSAAEAQVKLIESLTGISEEMKDVGLAVQQAEEKTEKMKARSSALDELLQSRTLTDLSGGSELEQEIALVKAKSSVDDELARIKNEMNIEITEMQK